MIHTIRGRYEREARKRTLTNVSSTGCGVASGLAENVLRENWEGALVHRTDAIFGPKVLFVLESQ
jgi:hypothetical protein